MAYEAELLRRLEPAVRPAGAPAPNRPPTAPIEQQSFDQLLDDAAQPHDHAAEAARHDDSQAAAAMLNRLGTIVNIPNRTVLSAMPLDRAQNGAATPADLTQLASAPPPHDLAEAAMETS